MIHERHVQAELMDQPDLDQALHVHALRGLQRINTVSRTAAIHWPTIADVAASIAPAKLRVLDVACGGGDNALSIARRARLAGMAIEVDGCDVSDRAVSEAQRRATEAAADNVKFFHLDALAQRFPAGYHVLMSSLFLHHLDENSACNLLRKMAAAATSAVMICDLQRSWLGYGLAWFGCRILTRSPVVHVDGPRSVAAAFAASEISRMAAQRIGRDHDYEPLAAALVARVEETLTSFPGQFVGDASSRIWDAIVIGAGPAGAIAAQQLARQGAATLLVERHSFPRAKVCGGCLNGRALLGLSSLGLDQVVAAASPMPVNRLLLRAQNRCAVLGLPAGVAIDRSTFDAALVRAAIAAGTAFLPETTAIVDPDCLPGASYRTVQLSCRGQTIERACARVILAADGLGHPSLRHVEAFRSRVARHARVGVGLVHKTPQDAYGAGTIHMAIARDGYVGLVRTADGNLNVAAAIDPGALKRSDGPADVINRILQDAGMPSLPSTPAHAWRGTLPLSREQTIGCRQNLRARRCRRILRAIHRRGYGLGDFIRRFGHSIRCTVISQLG